MILIILLSLLIPFFFDPSCISFLIAHKLREVVSCGSNIMHE
jgi:hypothetical protein